MKKQWIISIAALLVIILGVWFFWPKNQDSHARVIPADATALTELDIADFMQESDLTEDKIKKLFPKDVDLLNCGLDLQKNAFAFVDAMGMNGCLFAVEDIDLLKDFLSRNGERMAISPVEEQQGYFWSMLGNSFVLGFDDEVLMIMGPTVASAQAELRQQMLGYLKQSKDESVLKAPLFKKLQDQEGFLKAVASLEMFPEYYKAFQNLGLPEHVDFSKMLMTVSVGAEKGRVVFRTGVVAEDKALAQKMKALDDLSRRIDGDFITSVSPNTMLWMGMNLKGDKLMKQIGEMPTLRLYLMAMNHVMDVEEMIRHIDGDVSLAATMEGEPVFQVQAQMANFSFMDEADYWIASAKHSGAYRFDRLDEDLYCIGNVARKDLYMGLKDKNLLFTTSRRAMDELQKGLDHDLLVPYREDIKESKFYIWANLRSLNSALQSFGVSDDDPEMQQVEKFFGKFNAVALRSTNATSIDLIFYMKDKERGLKQLFE